MSAGIDISQRIPVHVTVAIERLRIGRVGDYLIRLDEAVDIRRTRVLKVVVKVRKHFEFERITLPQVPELCPTGHPHNTGMNCAAFERRK
jgi:hypothetical protein